MRQYVCSAFWQGASQRGFVSRISELQHPTTTPMMEGWNGLMLNWYWRTGCLNRPNSDEKSVCFVLLRVEQMSVCVWVCVCVWADVCVWAGCQATLWIRMRSHKTPPHLPEPLILPLFLSHSHSLSLTVSVCVCTSVSLACNELPRVPYKVPVWARGT